MARQPNIAIQPTDKTSKVAIVDKALMEEKLYGHLLKGSFEELKGDPTLQYEKELRLLLNDLCKNQLGDKDILGALRTSYSTTPTIYSLQKDHKPDYPDCKVRPVQPVGTSAIYKVDILISKVLGQILPLLSYRVEDQTKFRDKLNTMSASGVEFMASFDIENMFPNMPINNRATAIIRDYLEEFESKIDLLGFDIEGIIRLLSFCLHHTYLEFRGKYFRQLNGVGTGSHTSPVYSEIIVDYIYKNAIEIVSLDICPSLYMDDGWLHWAWGMDEFHRFHDALNSIFPAEINFTYELEEERTINFLDMTITRKDDSFQYEFYRKPTHSGKYMDYTNHCPEATKLNIISSETRRVLDCCSEISLAWKHLETVRASFLASNYPEGVVAKRMIREVDDHVNQRTGTKSKVEYDYVIKVPYVSEAFTRIIKRSIRDLGISARVVPTSGRSIGTYIRDHGTNICECALCKQGMKCKERHVVYEAVCRICDYNYIGVCNRWLEKRLSEHEASIRLENQRTTLGAHVTQHTADQYSTPFCTEKPNMENLLDSYTVNKIDKGKDTIEAFIKEGLRIREKKPMLNEKLENGWVR